MGVLIASKIDTRGPGSPVVVFNTLGWPRSDIVEIDVGFGEGGVAASIVTDPDGRTVPAQILESTRYWRRRTEDGPSSRSSRATSPRWDIAPITSPRVVDPRSEHGLDRRHDGVLENELYRVALDPSTGAMTSLRVKAGDWEVLAGPGNVVARRARPRRPLGAL